MAYGRGKMFLDDLIFCIYGAVSRVPSSKTDNAMVSKMLRICLCFMFTGRVNFNATVYTKLTKLRKSIRQEIVRVHRDQLGKLPGIADSKKASTKELADALMRELGEDSAGDGEVVVEASPQERQVMEIMEDAETLADVVKFIQDPQTSNLQIRFNFPI